MTLKPSGSGIDIDILGDIEHESDRSSSLAWVRTSACPRHCILEFVVYIDPPTTPGLIGSPMAAPLIVSLCASRPPRDAKDRRKRLQSDVEGVAGLIEAIEATRHQTRAHNKAE